MERIKLGRFKWIRYPLYVIIVFGFSIALRLFVFEIYSIPSSSMENTLIPGDKVLVNKLLMGPRLPQSPFDIPWVNIAFLLSKRSREKINSVWWPYHRIKGFSRIIHNDVLVFDSPLKDDLIFIKRCVALPGDTLTIRNADVYFNGKKAVTSEKIRLRYTLGTDSLTALYYYLDSIRVNPYSLNSTGNSHYLETCLDKSQAEQLKHSGLCNSLDPCPELPGTGKMPPPYINAGDPDWTIDYFGPLVIPSKNFIIKMDYQNYLRYKTTIQNSEGHDLEYKNNQVYMEGVAITSYTFQHDYYFMMGDHRYDSRDSRYIGLVPETLIIGKTRRILFSNHQGFRLERTLKRIY